MRNNMKNSADRKVCIISVPSAEDVRTSKSSSLPAGEL